MAPNISSLAFPVKFTGLRVDLLAPLFYTVFYVYQALRIRLDHRLVAGTFSTST